MRVFIGLTEVSGYYAGLTRGFKELGIPCRHLPLQRHPFEYEEVKTRNPILALSRYSVYRRLKISEKSSIGKVFWLGMAFLTRLLILTWALIRYDVFLLGGGSSFFRFKEFKILKFFGKRIIYTFHGTDSRPPYIDGFTEIGEPGDGRPSAAFVVSPKMVDEYVQLSKRRREDVRKVEKYADIIINAPPQAHFHSRPFVIGLVVGLPLNRNLKIGEEKNAWMRNAVRILHSPSRIEGKGTHIIRAAVANLRDKGYAIDFIEISNKPHSQVVSELGRCDFVVDQAYSDSPMAGFASEAAFNGLPSVVGGYYCEHIQNDVPSACIPPSVYCLPEDIERGIEKLITDEEFRINLGKQAQIFVSRNWTAQEVASRYLNLIRGDFPEEWLYDPGRIRYLHGMGLCKKRSRAIISAILDRHGAEALQLEDKPVLRDLFVAFAREKAP